MTIADNTVGYLSLWGISGPLEVKDNTARTIAVGDNAAGSQAKELSSGSGSITQHIHSNRLDDAFEAGILLDDDASYIEVSGNSVTSCFDAYSMGISNYGTNNEILNNVIRDCSIGISVGGANNLVQYNDIDCNNIEDPDPYWLGGGILLRYSSQQIIGNKVANCKKSLFARGYSSSSFPTINNTVKDNRFENNTNNVYLQGYVRDNQIYNNIFGVFTGAANIDAQNLDCTESGKEGASAVSGNYAVPSPCPNTWSQTRAAGENIVGEPYLGGNYWRDYTGVDADGDGIGDTPYTINDDNIDNLPLVYDNVVNSTGDDPDATVGDGLCDTGKTISRSGADENECTLRAAIQESNASSDKDTIAFDIHGSTIPTILLGSQLPQVTAPLVIDATTQPGTNRVKLDGTGAADANGLIFQTDSGTSKVKGLTVQNFKKNGISAANQLIVLVNVEILDNCGWGVHAQNGISIDVIPGMALSSAINRVNGNGAGSGCQGGGIWSYDGAVGAHNLEVIGNGGPGILASDIILLYSVQSNNNRGPGIQSFLSRVVIGWLPEVGILNQVIGNKGHGIHAYQNTEREACEEGLCDGVIIKSPIEVSGNGGWVISAQGDVVVNQVWGRTASFKISNNNRGVECWAMDDRESDLALGNCEGGGILSEDGSVSVRVFEVSDNGGPGVDASDGVFLLAGKVCRNLGRGVHAGGSLTLRQVTVCGNQGSGVHLSGGATGKRPPERHVPGATGTASSQISGSMIVDNVGDGIFFDRGGSPTVSSSNIYGNTGSGINNQDANVSIDARNNWWGDAGGPGSNISGNVDYSDWRTALVALSVAAGADITGVRGADAHARFFLTNFTASGETYDITVSDTLSWGLALTSQAVTLGAGESGEMVLAVTIPVSASNGTEDEVSLTATGTVDPSVTGSAIVKVTARTMLINEVHPGEGWVELFNPGPGDLPLAGWRLIDGDGELDFAIPEQDVDWDGLLEEGAYLVIHLLAGDAADTPSEDIYAEAGAVLSGTGNSLALLNPDGVEIDFMMYGDSQDIPPDGTGWTGTNTGAPQTAQSLGRDQYGSDSDSAADWENTCGADADSPTPGRKNLPSALISVNPASYRFGDVVREGSSAAESFVVVSTGEQSLQIGTLSLSGRDAFYFSIGNYNCSGQTLAASAACTFEIVLSPALDGLHIANLLIPSNDPVDPLLLIPLRGNGQCVAGDANNDRLSNILDVILAMRISLGHPPFTGASARWMWMTTARLTSSTLSA